VSGATGSRKRSFPELNGKLVTAPIFQSAGSAFVTMSK
jgi:hypothetical protein